MVGCYVPRQLGWASSLEVGGSPQIVFISHMLGILLKQPSLTIEKTTHVSLHKSLWPAGKAWLHTLAQIQGILAQGRRHHSRHFHTHQPRDTGEGGSWLLQNPAPFPHAWHDLDGRNLCHITGLDTFPLVYSCTRSWDDLFFFLLGGA